MQTVLLKMGKAFTKYTEIVIGFFIVAIIGIIIIPMPSSVLDLLLVTNISMGVIILLLTLSTKKRVAVLNLSHGTSDRHHVSSGSEHLLHPADIKPGSCWLCHQCLR